MGDNLKINDIIYEKEGPSLETIIKEFLLIYYNEELIND